MDSCTALSKRSLLALFYRSVPVYSIRDMRRWMVANLDADVLPDFGIRCG